MIRNGRRTAISVAAIGVLTIVLVAFFGRDRIAEEWWLWKLSRASTVPDEIKPVERLGELRSVWAVPLIFDRIRTREEAPGTGFHTMFNALMHIGAPAVPHLIQNLDHQDEDTRRLSIAILRELGPQARNAIPALIAKVRDPDCEERVDAAIALGKIGPPATVMPVLIGISKDENADELLRDIATEAIKELKQIEDLQE